MVLLGGGRFFCERGTSVKRSSHLVVTHKNKESMPTASMRELNQDSTLVQSGPEDFTRVVKTSLLIEVTLVDHPRIKKCVF